MVTLTPGRTRIAGCLVLLSWLVGLGPLNMGLEKEQGHVLSAALFAVACLIWSLAHRMLANSSRNARVASFAVPSFWAFSIVVTGIIQLREGYWDWFPLASACIVGIALAGALVSRRSRLAQSTDLRSRNNTGIR